MVTFLIYMIKISLGLILFYLFFKVLLSRETFFRLNRFVLLGGVVVCLALPNMRLSLPGEQLYIQQQFVRLENAWRMDDPDTTVGWEVVESGINEEKQSPVTSLLGEISRSGLKMAMGIYLLGGIVVLGIYSVSFYRMMKLIRQGQNLNYKYGKLILIDQVIAPFSFGSYIVISAKDYQEYAEEILTHEYMHVKNHHTLDLLFLELLSVVLWFNPVVWLLKKELQKIHEYQADRGVIDNGIDATKYQLLLVKKAVGVRLYSLANSFNHSKLKNRITMMLKEKSNHWARLKVLLLIPPAIFTMYAFARPDSALATLSPLQSFKITQIPDDPEMWSREFFESEYQRNALRLKFPLEYNQMVEGQPIILMNRNGQLAFNRQLVDHGKLKKELTEKLIAQTGEQPVVTFVLKDEKAPESAQRELLEAIGSAYQVVRQKIMAQHTGQTVEYLDQECPVLVYFLGSKIKLKSLPPAPSPLIALKLNGEGVKEKCLIAYDLTQLNKKLDEVKELKQYSVATLGVEKRQMDSLREPLLECLRQRGILKVNVQTLE